MKSTYKPKTKTDWHKIEMDCMMVTIAIVACMLITCFFVKYEIDKSGYGLNASIEQLWTLGSVRVLTAFIPFLLISMVAGMFSIGLQDTNYENY